MYYVCVGFTSGSPEPNLTPRRLTSLPPPSRWKVGSGTGEREPPARSSAPKVDPFGGQAKAAADVTDAAAKMSLSDAK